jgi:hypothetical protein
MTLTYLISTDGLADNHSRNAGRCQDRRCCSQRWRLPYLGAENNLQIMKRARQIGPRAWTIVFNTCLNQDCLCPSTCQPFCSTHDLDFQILLWHCGKGVNNHAVGRRLINLSHRSSAAFHYSRSCAAHKMRRLDIVPWRWLPCCGSDSEAVAERAAVCDQGCGRQVLVCGRTADDCWLLTL